MSLDRQNVTAASRIMLPTYVVFFGVLGVNYLIADDTAAANPALVFANAMMPLPVWGALFIICSCGMAGALATKRRLPYRFALRICAGAMGLWAIVILLASLAGDATPFAACWAAFVAVACMASDKSLATGER